MTTTDTSIILSRDGASFERIEQLSPENDAPASLRVDGWCGWSSFFVVGHRTRDEGAVRVLVVYIDKATNSQRGPMDFHLEVPLTEDISEVHFGEKGRVIWTREKGPHWEFGTIR